MARRTAAADAALTAQARVAVLYGGEAMLMRLKFEELRQALTDAYGEVDVITFDGQSASLADVLDELRTFSLLQQHKLVVVDDAQDFVKTHREALERYACAPVEHGTLLFRAAAWNRGKLDDMIEKNAGGAVIKCAPVDRREAQSWLTQRAKQHYQRLLTPDVAALLVDRLGVDLMRLESELAKLSPMVPEKQPIPRELIEQLVGKSSDEQVWVLQETLVQALATSLGIAPAAAGGSYGGSYHRSPAPAPAARKAGSAPPAAALLEKMHEVVDLAGESDVLVMYAVGDIIRRLTLAKLLYRQRVPISQISSQLRLFRVPQPTLAALLDRLDEARLQQLYDRAIELDARSKSGFGDAMRNLECFCSLLTGA